MKLTIYHFILWIFFIFALCFYTSSGLEDHTYGKFADLKRTVALTGFHRILEYHVIIHNVTGPTGLLIEERLPADVYVDPHQLSREIEEGKIKIPDSDKISVESPAYQANPINVKLCSSSANNIHKLHFPIHMRYQKPQLCDIFGENVTVKLGTPFIYFRDHTNCAIQNVIHRTKVPIANRKIWVSLIIDELIEWGQ